MNNIKLAELLEKLTPEVHDWQCHNFPLSKPYQSLLGIIEEFGELITAKLGNSKVGVVDAIGDILVYMMDYCQKQEWNLSEIYKNRDTDEACLIAGVCLGKLAHAHLKLEQGIRGNPAELVNSTHDMLQALVMICEDAAISYSVDVCDALSVTWSEVKKRDWQKNKINGVNE